MTFDCSCEAVSDSASRANSDMNGIVLNDETDDEDMEDGETRFDEGSAPVRNIRDPGQPIGGERREHMNTHRPYKSWCKFCVMGRGVNSPHRRSDAQDGLEGVPHVSMDFGFLGEEESEERVTPVLVIRERRDRMTWAMLGPRQGTEFSWIAQRAAKFIDQVGHNSVILRCDHLRRWQGKLHQLVKGEARLCQRDHQWERASPTESPIARWDSWLVRAERWKKHWGIVLAPRSRLMH